MNESYRNLEIRLLEYAKRVFRLAETVKYGDNLAVLTRQLLRSATSVGANYAESLDALYPKERLHRLIICRKELRESHYWLGLICGVKPALKLSELMDETRQLRSIFTALISNAQQKQKNKSAS